MAEIADIQRLIEPAVEAEGLALVRVRMIGGGSDPTLQVMAERPDTRQLSLEDCARLSRRISDMLDRLEAESRDPIEGGYRLEVSSPGIDRPLTRLSDYDDWKGHEARIVLEEKLNGRKAYSGELAGSEGETVLIDIAGSGRTALPFAAVRSAKLVMTDKLIAATAPLDIEGADAIEADADQDELEEEGQD